MSNLFLTLVIAFVIIVFAIALLAIGWLITGKTRIEKGCGRDPTKAKDQSCQACDVCSHAPPSKEILEKNPKEHLEESKNDSCSHP